MVKLYVYAQRYSLRIGNRLRLSTVEHSDSIVLKFKPRLYSKVTNLGLNFERLHEGSHILFLATLPSLYLYLFCD